MTTAVLVYRTLRESGAMTTDEICRVMSINRNQFYASIRRLNSQGCVRKTVKNAPLGFRYEATEVVPARGRRGA